MTATRSAGAMGMVCVALLVACAADAAAQTNHEVNAAVQFNFSNPGARSLALGGSLTGLADDATAALTNPSGLPLLPSPEISAEGRGFHFSTLFTQRGNLGQSIGFGVDTINGLEQGEAKSSTGGLSFISIVYPKESWGVAFYRTELSRFKTTVDTDGPFFSTRIVGNTADVTRFRPMNATLDLTVVAWGGSGAVRLGKVAFLGAGVSFNQLDLSSLQQRFCTNCASNVGFQPGSLLGAPLKTSSNVQDVERQDSTETAPAFNVGFTLRPTPRFGVGASYRQGPKFDVAIVNRDGPAGAHPDQTTFEGTGTFKVPDIVSFGAVAMPNVGSNTLRISGEVRLVRYSQLTNDFILSVTPTETPSNYHVDDGTEVRLGAEYLFVGKTTLALRGGAWLDPDHRIAYTGSGLDQVVFRPGEDEWHYTGGAGVSVGRAQVDAGFDYSARAVTFGASLIVRF